MARIEGEPMTEGSAKQKRTKKRKMNDSSRSYDDVESPTTKFKKLDISQINEKRQSSSHTTPKKSLQTYCWSVATVSSAAASAPQAPKASSSSSSSSSNAATSESPAAEPQSHAAAAPKTKKRKHQPASADDSTKNPPKKSKHNVAAAAAEPIDADDDDEATAAIREPTAAELNHADRPENQPQIETTRQKKRDKRAKVESTAKVESRQREKLRDQEYLQLWRDDRAAWKFNKLRQISVGKALFVDTDPLDDETWQLAMEYLCGAQGRFRQLLREAAQKVIDDIDARIGGSSGDGVDEAQLLQSVNYGRARTFMQMLE